MIARIRRFSVLQTGKVLAVLYGFFSIILLPILFIMLVKRPREFVPMILMIVLYPIMGFIGGIIVAALYNLSSRIVGGIEINLETEE